MSITDPDHTGSGADEESGVRAATTDPWVAAQRSADFIRLRWRLRTFVFPMTAFFLVWYFAYVLLAAFAPDFMAVRLMGNINVGLVIGLLQFVTTFVIAMVYVRYASERLDPIGADIRERVEGSAR